MRMKKKKNTKRKKVMCSVIHEIFCGALNIYMRHNTYNKSVPKFNIVQAIFVLSNIASKQELKMFTLLLIERDENWNYISWNSSSWGNVYSNLNQACLIFLVTFWTYPARRSKKEEEINRRKTKTKKVTRNFRLSLASFLKRPKRN